MRQFAVILNEPCIIKYKPVKAGFKQNDVVIEIWLKSGELHWACSCQYRIFDRQLNRIENKGTDRCTAAHGRSYK